MSTRTWCRFSSESSCAAFAAQLGSLEGGDVWEFRSPRETWQTLRVGGRKGLCLVRDQNIVAVYITMLS